MPNDIMTVKIISKKYGEGATTADYNSGKAAIGTGPYKFVKWVPGDRIELKANENYHGAGTGKPKYKNVLFKPIKSGPARIAALLAAQLAPQSVPRRSFTWPPQRQAHARPQTTPRWA